MKKLFLLSVLVLMFAVTAQAAPTKFSRFTLDVPSGWSFEENPQTGVVRLYAQDRSASSFWVMGFHNGRSLMEFAKELSQTLGGGTPEQVKDLEVSFSVEKPNEPKTQCYLWKWEDHPEFFAVCDTGTSTEFDRINDSFKMNNPDSFSEKEGPVAFDLPEGWSSEHNKDAKVVACFPGKDLNKANSVVTLTYGPLQGTLDEAATYFAKRHESEGSLKKLGGDVYTFNGSLAGLPNSCRMVGYGKNFLLTCATGTDPLLPDLAASARYVGE